MIGLVKTAPGPGHLALREVAEPEPGPGQVVVEVQAAGLCASDLHIRDWDIKLNLKPPVVIGHEFAGRLHALGEGVPGLEVGDRVTSETAFFVCGRCRPCRSGEYNACARKELIGYVHNGCFAPYVRVPAERVHLVPPGVETMEAALCEPLASVVRGTLELTRIGPGDLVVVAGPGPIGLLALQVARSAGASVVVTGSTGDEARLELAGKLGAVRTVNVAQEKLGQVLGELGAQEGADVYLECSGAAPSVRAGLEAVRRRGQFTQIGLPAKPLELDFAQVAYKELVVHGSLGQRWSAWRTALSLLANGQVDVRALITHTFPLREWERAFECFEGREGLKIVFSEFGR